MWHNHDEEPPDKGTEGQRLQQKAPQLNSLAGRFVTNKMARIFL
jgi:hypothetical protein